MRGPLLGCAPQAGRGLEGGDTGNLPPWTLRSPSTKLDVHRIPVYLSSLAASLGSTNIAGYNDPGHPVSAGRGPGRASWVLCFGCPQGGLGLGPRRGLSWGRTRVQALSGSWRNLLPCGRGTQEALFPKEGRTSARVCEQVTGSQDTAEPPAWDFVALSRPRG